MYKKLINQKSSITVNHAEIGETIETKFERILNNKEPIKDGAPLIYMERKEGLQPAYDIRTDRFEVAVMGMDKIDKSIKAKREEKAKLFAVKEEEEVGKTESIDGTNKE